MDPVRFAFSAEMRALIESGDDFVIRTILSKNDQFDPNDMISMPSIRGSGTGEI